MVPPGAGKPGETCSAGQGDRLATRQLGKLQGTGCGICNWTAWPAKAPHYTVNRYALHRLKEPAVVRGSAHDSYPVWEVVGPDREASFWILAEPEQDLGSAK